MTTKDTGSQLFTQDSLYYLDPLNINVNRAILQEAFKICEIFGLRVIVSMRDRTYDAIAAEPDGLFRTYPCKEPISVEKRNIKEYLEGRIQSALRGVKTEEYTYIDLLGKRYTQADAEKVISSMLHVLLTKEAAEFLDYITYHNLRQLNDVIKVYLSTGYIEHHTLNAAVIVDRIAQGESFKCPLWVLLSSVLTANHETHFSDNCPAPIVLRSILNLYCNRQGGFNRYQIRIQILNLFMREEKKLTVSKLIQAFEEMLGPMSNPLREDLLISMDHALHRFLECQLLVSPEYYKVTNSSVIGKVNNLELTDTGEYYLKTLSGYFEYLVYMKDDVELPKTTHIKDCIEVKDRSGRYEQVYNFLRFLFDQEKGFLRSLKGPQRRIYLKHFSRHFDNNPFTISTAVERMINYGEINNLDTSKFSSLLRDIEHECENFI